MKTGGRWAVVSLDRPSGAAVDVLTPFMWNPQAQDELRRMQLDSTSPELLGLAACKQCNASDEGCERCNPDREPVPGVGRRV